MKKAENDPLSSPSFYLAISPVFPGQAAQYVSLESGKIGLRVFYTEPPRPQSKLFGSVALKRKVASKRNI